MKQSKLILFSILAAASIIFITGCQQLGGKRDVLVWSYAISNISEWNERKADIEKKFNITLKVVEIAQNAFVEKLQAAMLAGKEVPQIIEWMIDNNRILNADPKKSFVLPLNEYIRNSDTFQKVPASRVAWVTYGGRIYGLPHDVHPVILVYNDTLWKKAGVDVAAIKTWDEFMAAAKNLTAVKKDGKPIHYALPSSFGGLGDTMFMVWQQTGSQILSADGKPTLTDAKFADFVKKWISWVDTGIFTSWDWGLFPTLLRNGTLASYTSPDWFVTQIDEAVKDGIYQFKVRDLPLYEEGGPRTASWSGTFLAITRGSKNPANLYKIIEYMQYDLSTVKNRYVTTGMIPPFSEVWEDEVFRKEDPRFGGQRLGELQITLAKELPSIRTGDIFWDTIIDFNQQYAEMETKKISVDKGLANAQEASLKRIVE